MCRHRRNELQAVDKRGRGAPHSGREGVGYERRHYHVWERSADGYPAGSTEVRKIEEKRIPQPIECIYILTPEDFSVQCLISDFARERPRYTAAHLLWTSGMHTGSKGEGALVSY